MSAWTEFPHLGDYAFDEARLKKHWARLHAGDALAWPGQRAVVQAWLLFHQGHFEQAAAIGWEAGLHGLAVACKATCTHANYLEESEKRRQEFYQEVAQRAQAIATEHPDHVPAHYWNAYALGRYSQGISVAKALAQGLGVRIKQSLQTTMTLQPTHADAHLALATFQAEVIDKVGALIGAMTYGARKETALDLFEQALVLNPHSAQVWIEYANGLVMLEGSSRLDDATRHYEKASQLEPLDASERLAVELARAELQD